MGNRAPVAVIDAGTGADPLHAGQPWIDEIDLVDVYDLPDTDLSGHAGMVVEGMVDQEYLHRHRRVIRHFLDSGGVVAWSGHLLRPWLPGCGTFVPKEISSFRDYTVSVVTPHPVFTGVDPADLTFRQGVAGFFARGHHPPPPGAQVLLALPGGEPVVWVDHTGAGTVLAHAGSGLLGFAEAGTSAERIGPQLLEWIQAEGAR